jgi:hypothetical protein
MTSEDNFIESFIKSFSGLVDNIISSLNLEVIGFSALTTYSTCIEYIKGVFNDICLEFPIVKKIADEVVYYSNYTKSVCYNYRIEPRNSTWISTSMLMKYDYNDSPYFIESYNDFDCDEYLKPRGLSTKYEDVCGTNLHNFEESNHQTSNETRLEETLTILKYENQYLTYFVSDYKKEQQKRLRLPINESKVSFLSIEYIHPVMDKGIPLELDKGFLLVNNCLFSPLFIKRMLEYQSTRTYFSNDYTLKIMDSDLNMIELKYGQYIRLNEKDYIIAGFVNEK